MALGIFDIVFKVSGAGDAVQGLKAVKTEAKHESEFSVDGTAIFRMKDGSLSSQLTVYVPPEDPLGDLLSTHIPRSDDIREAHIWATRRRYEANDTCQDLGLSKITLTRSEA